MKEITKLDVLKKLKLESKSPKLNDIVLYRQEICFVNGITPKTIELVFHSEKDDTLKVYKLKTKMKEYDIIKNEDVYLNPKLKDMLESNKVIYSKNDYVSYLEDGVKVYGTVLSVGKNIKVLLSDFKHETLINKRFLTKETPPVIEIPKKLKDWTFISYKENKAMSQETICFSVSVKKNNKKVFEAYNQGCGGCMLVNHMVENKSAPKDFLNDVKIASIELFPKLKDSIFINEIDESYILWFNNERKQYLSWGNYLKNLLEY